MFVGREKELSELKNQFKSESKSIVLVYGKRRVGKTRLLQEALMDYDGTVVNHLCVKSSFEGNLRLLCRSVALSFGLSPSFSVASLYDLFGSVNYFGLHDSQKALDAIEKSIELWPYDPNSQALRGVFRTDIQKPIERYTKLQDIIQYKEAEVDSNFLGGASLTASTIGFTVATGGTTIAATTAEIAILSGVAALGLGTISMALLKDYSFEYTPDGGVKLTHK